MMTQQPSSNSHRKILWAIAGGAFLLRLIVLIVGKTYWYKEIDPAWGWEVGWISRSLAEGRGFGSPFGGETGPTAWIAPLYPSLQALVFKVFGIQSLSSAFVMRFLNCLTAPAMCILLYRIASRMWSERIGMVAALVWAFFPNSVWYDTCILWDTILTTCVFFTLVDLATAEPQGRSVDLRLGLLAGVLALLNPAMLTGVAACLLWRWSRTNDRRLRSMAWTGVLALAIVTPWTVRNYLVFGKPVFIRSNFGHELYKGSNLGATGQNNTGLNPAANLSEFNRYVALGEVGYVTSNGNEAKRLIRKYPAWFFKLTRRRVDAFWNGPTDVTSMFEFNDAHLAFKKFFYAFVSFAGLGGILVALLRRERFAALFAGIILLYPMIYYITFPNVRYRLPLEPILLMYGLYLGATTFGYVRGRLSSRQRRRGYGSSIPSADAARATASLDGR
jgi:4-amino-4-deoxy-L-arabinose transferase-like glycosyltransferase